MSDQTENKASEVEETAGKEEVNPDVAADLTTADNALDPRKLMLDTRKRMKMTGLTVMDSVIYRGFMTMAVAALNYITDSTFRTAYNSMLQSMISRTMNLSASISQLPDNIDLAMAMKERKLSKHEIARRSFGAAAEYDALVGILTLNMEMAFEFIKQYFKERIAHLTVERDFCLSFCHEYRAQEREDSILFEGLGSIGYSQPSSEKLKVNKEYKPSEDSFLGGLIQHGYVVEKTTYSVNIAKIKADKKVGQLPSCCENLMDNIEEIKTPGRSYWRLADDSSSTKRKLNMDGAGIEAFINYISEQPIVKKGDTGHETTEAPS